MIQRNWESPAVRKRPPLLLEMPLAEGINVSRIGTVKLTIICKDTGASVTLNMKNNHNVVGEERQAVLGLDRKPLETVLGSDILMILTNRSGEAEFSIDEGAGHIHKC